ncbi:hypothetical protein GPJ56_007233 [Histomonas meleagridis]|nr:hypothetical protein GPJ56_007233 [Histomonas meleagridis]
MMVTQWRGDPGQETQGSGSGEYPGGGDTQVVEPRRDNEAVEVQAGGDPGRLETRQSGDPGQVRPRRGGTRWQAPVVRHSVCGTQAGEHPGVVAPEAGGDPGSGRPGVDGPRWQVRTQVVVETAAWQWRHSGGWEAQAGGGSGVSTGMRPRQGGGSGGGVAVQWRLRQQEPRRVETEAGAPSGVEARRAGPGVAGGGDPGRDAVWWHPR